MMVVAIVSSLASMVALGQGRVAPGGPGRELPAPPATEPTLRLAILPDRTTGRAWGLHYLRLAVDDLNRIRPNAVISIGDMIQGYTRSIDIWAEEAAEFLDCIAPLEMPFYPLAGNHEVVSGTRRRDDDTFEKRYVAMFAPLYYAIEFDLATAIVCYSDDPEFSKEARYGFGPSQLAWLRDTLERASHRAKPIIVLMHRPLWRGQTSNWETDVHPLLVAHQADVVIAGHFHAMQRDPDRDGIEYHIVGTCGGMIDQYPTAGQLQHLTFLTIDATGRIGIHHQPVGTTLPDDFVIRADQDRVFALKSSANVVRFLDAPTDPADEPFEGRVRVELHNPLDVPVVFRPSIVRERPASRTWATAYWVSRMEQDRFNPHTTNIHTPFRIAEYPPECALEPGGTIVVEWPLVAPSAARYDNPPDFHIEATFIDMKGRDVPVILRTRLPLRRTIDLTTRPIATLPVCAWSFSVFETAEPNPSASFAVDRDFLTIHVDVPDDVQSFHEGSDSIAARHLDPTSDAIALRIRRGGVEDRYFIEPFGDTTVWKIDGETASPTNWPVAPPVLIEDGRAWRLTLHVPRSLVALSADGVPSTINLGVGDNDETFHTQWRWIAPDQLPCPVLLPNSP